MQQRFLYLWLTQWKIDCHRIASPVCGNETRQSPKADVPLIITRVDPKGVLVCGLNGAAYQAGLHGAMRLSDARSILPDLTNISEEPDRYQSELTRLIQFMDRYSPWIAPDRVLHTQSLQGDAGLWLDITGGSHLFGGEAAMLGQVLRDVQARGMHARAAIADTAGAAWAAARCHPDAPDQRILHLPRDHTVAARFPVSCLRLTDDILTLLSRLGLKRLGDIAPLPRANITTRLGPDVLQRLDQFYGRLPEHLSFELPKHRWLIGRSFGEPLGDAVTLAQAVEAMMAELCERLRGENLGLRRVVLRCIQVDGHTHTIAVTTGSPCQIELHILRLLAEKMPGVDAGFGIEQIVLYAPWVEHVTFRQVRLDQKQDDSGGTIALAQLVDRVMHHLGADDTLFYPGHHASHLPERAAVRQAVTGPVKPVRLDNVSLPRRPVRLIDPPEPVDILARSDTGTPIRLRWRKMTVEILRAEGPERICPEWWEHLDRHDFALSQQTRDYFRVCDQKGQMLWLFRSGSFGQDIWSVHGLFGG